MQKCLFSIAKKRDFGCPKTKNDDHFFHKGGFGAHGIGISKVIPFNVASTEMNLPRFQS